MLDSLKNGLQSAVKKLIRVSVVDEAVIKEFVRDLQRTLIQADVSVKLVLNVTEAVQRRAFDEKPIAGITRKDQIVKVLYEEFSKLLGGDVAFHLSKDKKNVIVMLGVQGSGKTTTVAKLARFYTKKGFKVGVIAADIFRPGAIIQLKMLCSSIGVEVYSDEKQRDSLKIIELGKAYFESKNLVIIDTAGRHKEEMGLLDEMREIVLRVKPDMNLLVIDGTIGQQCYNQALAFHRMSPVGGIVVTKLDGAAKGGGALAATVATGAKILFIGTGERLDDLEEFSPTQFVGRLLGMGDLKSLLDMVRRLESEVDEKRMRRMVAGKFTMDDFLYQLEQMNKIGSLKKIIELVPGLSGIMKDEDLEKAENNISIWKNLIQSMTKEEREDSDLINSSRIRRIAKGSGRTEKEIKELIARYRQAKSFMKTSKNREFKQLLRRIGG
jgi:signal recognition particle subunit SRP54